MPWRGLVLRQALGEAAAERILAWDQALAPWLDRFGYASLTLAGGDEPVLTLQLAALQPPSPELLAAVEQAAALAAAPLRYDDVRSGVHKRALIEDGRLSGVALFGETAAASWLRAAMLTGEPAEPLRRRLFAPSAAAPAPIAVRSRIVCTCHGISAAAIERAIGGEACSLPALQRRLACGTGCGACVPELNRMLAAAAAAA